MSTQLISPNLVNRRGNKSKIFHNSKTKKLNLEFITKDLSELVNSNPYPGDLKVESYNWITETALYMDKAYNPNFMFISYANPYYASLHTHPDDLNWEDHLEQLFYEVGRFVNETDYIPIIIGTGGTYPIEGIIDLSGLDGAANYNWPGLVYNSLYNTTPKDLKLIEKDASIQMIIPCERLRVMVEEPKNYLPDYFLLAKRGYAFLNEMSESVYRVNARDVNVPIIAPQSIHNISQVNKLIKSLLYKQKRVVLIILEGISCTDFRWNYQTCSNTYSWFTYLPEEFQYLTIGTSFKLPYLLNKFCSSQLTFDKFLLKLPYENRTIGNKLNIRSAAIGSRRTLTHLASGADISLECGY